MFSANLKQVLYELCLKSNSKPQDFCDSYFLHPPLSGLSLSFYIIETIL